jgi:hypothetical protein
MLPTVTSPTTDLQPRLAPLLFLLLLLTACGHDKSIQPDAQTLPTPTDEATTDQKAMIGDTLSKIEATTTALGQPHSFRSLPVIVTSEKHYLSESKGACIKLGRRPQFILVSPAVLEFEKRLAPDSKSSTLFPVLLHEISHCYFLRSHDSAKINLEGSAISLLTKANNGEEVVQSLDASVMAPDTLVMECQLERYYVAEVLGLAKSRNLEALNTFAPQGLSAKFVKHESEEPKK